ncbi:surface antigen [Bradyrhizobium sp. GM22.5]
MVLFSIHPVPETLKFCELRGKGFETLAKNSGRVVHSSADFHVSSPRQYVRENSASFDVGKKNMQSKENATNSACCVADDDAAAR